ncbi:hypothetical protein Gogos_000611 [Gossypium gossypioides]|uniref:Terpene synthase metal-binding domain-containing protein n=1 Tax=Gossypium gossypioides TaxID=34282 RepID=A0A7J9CTZ4_GOSGO|nr:hypothetical protein [Gossypium gossypioides]
MVEDALNTLGLNILPYIKDQLVWPTYFLQCLRIPAHSINVNCNYSSSGPDGKRGDNKFNPMLHEGPVSEEEARDHIKGLICDSWKKLNKLVAGSSLPTGFAETALAMTRCVQRMYQFSDWFGIQSKANKDCLNSCIW